ncbi:MAG TPA: GAF domain-containing protein [Gemmatimonadales bacterium]|jgi:GAF domain-containing protein|nr:GAF domain-containing protein [Gemmatimonadales bacterium]
MPHTQFAAPSEVQRLQDRIEELERERARLLALIEILRDLTGSLHYPDIVQSVTRRLGNLFGLDRCSVFLAARAGGPDVHLVASYEDPAIRNHLVDLSRYPEIRRSLETGQVVYIADALADPSLAAAAPQLASRRVRSITVVPLTWQGHVIGTLFLRTYRDGQPFTNEDVEFCRVVAEATARALRVAHRMERLQARQGVQALVVAERERAGMLAFIRRLLDAFAERDRGTAENVLPRVSGQELDRLVGVALTVISQEARGSQPPPKPQE